jgi:hypothetical protein
MRAGKCSALSLQMHDRHPGRKYRGRTYAVSGHIGDVERLLCCVSDVSSGPQNTVTGEAVGTGFNRPSHDRSL